VLEYDNAFGEKEKVEESEESLQSSNQSCKEFHFR
jgi:hypothetical protein